MSNFDRMNIGPTHPQHTGGPTTEVLVFEEAPQYTMLVAHFTGGMAKIYASNFCAHMNGRQRND